MLPVVADRADVDHAKRLRLRYAATCSVCSSSLTPGTEAFWSATAKSATCIPCGSQDRPIERGTAGASALREGQRRHDRREEAIKTRHPRLGKLILALTDDPQSTTAWAKGAGGEQVVGGWLDSITSAPVEVLHDRRIPGTKANIDHIAVTPSGIFVIDAKRYAGQVQSRNVGGWLRPEQHLYVGRRNCTNLVAGMRKQVEAVRRALPPTDATPIHPVLCFTGSEWSLFAKPFVIDGVTVIWPKSLVKLLVQPGALTPDAVAAVTRRIGLSLRAA